LEREQRKLSRKQHGSNNYERQRRRVAKCHAGLQRKRRDFLHTLSNYYAREYDFVAVEALNGKGNGVATEQPQHDVYRMANVFSLLEYKCERKGTHYAAADPRRTIKECASCGVSTDTPLWVREHSCPAARLRRTETRAQCGTFFLAVLKL